LRRRLDGLRQWYLQQWYLAAFGFLLQDAGSLWIEAARRVLMTRWNASSAWRSSGVAASQSKARESLISMR
jgi:hypothetical protein